MSLGRLRSPAVDCCSPSKSVPHSCFHQEYAILCAIMCFKGSQPHQSWSYLPCQSLAMLYKASNSLGHNFGQWDDRNEERELWEFFFKRGRRKILFVFFWYCLSFSHRWVSAEPCRPIVTIESWVWGRVNSWKDRHPASSWHCWSFSHETLNPFPETACFLDNLASLKLLLLEYFIVVQIHVLILHVSDTV